MFKLRINSLFTLNLYFLYTLEKNKIMIVKSLLGEFLHEAENTRKLLNAIPDSALSYKLQRNHGPQHN